MQLEKIKEKYEALQEKVQQHPALAIFIILGLVCMNVVTLFVGGLITRVHIVWITIVCLVISGLYAFYKKLTDKPPDYSYHQYHAALAPQVLESVTFYCNADPTFHQVKSVEDIGDIDYIYNEDSDTYKFFFLKKEATNIDPEKLTALGYKIEKRINKRLNNINTRTIRTFDKLPPKIGVVSIEDIGGDVELSIYIANNPEKRQQLARLKKEQQGVKRVVAADVDKTDDDF